MIRTLQCLLLALTVATAAADLALAASGRFAIDDAAYLRLALLAFGLFGLGLYYDRRRDARLGAMLLGTSFLCAFSAAASLLNYLLIPYAGARIDLALAAIDRAMGVNWPSLMGFMSLHPLFNRLLFIAYGVLLPQIALLIPVLAFARPLADLYRFCLALGIGALVTIGVWTLAPSFGAFSVYHLAPGLKLDLALDENYARALIALLKNGPGFIGPDNIRGLIGFPSYHAVLALLVIRFAWPVRWLRWPAFTLNALVFFATPIQGGHHVIDVLAAVPVTALALGLARAAEFLKPPAFANMVNEASKLTIECIPQERFRAAPAHLAAPPPPAIKSTLSRLS